MATNPTTPTVYVYVRELGLVKFDEHDPGRWLDPNTAHPMTAAQLESVREALGDRADEVIERVETIAEHHEASRKAAPASEEVA